MNRITVDYVMSLRPCYYREWVEDKFQGRKWVSPKTILDMDTVSAKDKIWFFARSDVLTDKQKHLFACDCAEHIPQTEKSLALIQKKRDWIDGKITDEELDADRASDWAAERDWQIAALKSFVDKED